MSTGDTITDALCLNTEEPVIELRRWRKLVRKAHDGHWYCYHEFFRFYGIEAYPQGDCPSTQGTEKSCKFLGKQIRDLTFRLQYAMSSKAETKEYETKLANPTEQLKKERQMYNQRQRVADDYWGAAQRLPQKTADIEQCAWFLAPEPSSR